MKPERRQQILGHIPHIKSLDEMDSFRRGLSEQGEMQDAEVFQAVWNRIEAIKAVKRR